MSSKKNYRCLVAIGSNLGDRDAYVKVAIAELEGISSFFMISNLYETAPVGTLGEQGKYLNLVALLVTSLDPDALIDYLLDIEAKNRRVRGEINAARTLDLDILYVYGFSSKTQKLMLPHPRMAERAFVIAPLLDVDPVLAFSISPKLADSIVRREKAIGGEVADGVVLLGHHLQ
jgi:2-amino-4-hydroxy-6-hydroxymethyldihydropteridine diphosphokinase